MIKPNVNFSVLKTLSLKPILLPVVAAILIPSIILGYQSKALNDQKNQATKQKEAISKELSVLKAEDQYKKNEKLSSEIKKIEETYKKSLSSYEEILDLADQKKNTDPHPNR